MDTPSVLSASTNEVSDPFAEHIHSTHHGLTPEQFTAYSKTWRGKVYIVLEYPKSSLLAEVMSWIKLVLIVYSVAILIAASYPQNDRIPVFKRLVLVSNFIVICFFTLEYALGLFCAPKWYRWIFEPLNVLDLIIIVPFYVTITNRDIYNFGNQSAIFRVLLLLRIVIIFKVAQYSQTFYITMHTIIKSGKELVFILYVLGIAVVFFSSAMYYAEQSEGSLKGDIWYRKDGTVSPFQNIPASMWWCVVTMATVGYGDAVPVTPLGKVVAVVTIISGVLLMALPVAITTASFSNLWKERAYVAKFRFRRRKKKKIVNDQSMITESTQNGEIPLENLEANEDLPVENPENEELQDALDNIIENQRFMIENLTKTRELLEDSEKLYSMNVELIDKLYTNLKKRK